MAELKPCPFCGGSDIELNVKKKERHALIGAEFKLKTLADRYQIKCSHCPCGTDFLFYAEDAIEAWNRRTKIETNIYDKEETYPNCTVQVLTNTATGEVSVGWWENGGKEE